MAFGSESYGSVALGSTAESFVPVITTLNTRQTMNDHPGVMFQVIETQ